MQCIPSIFDRVTDETVNAARFVSGKRRPVHHIAAALYEGLRWLLFSQK